MGIRNSSLTRVKPLFDFIGYDFEKLNSFLKLFNNLTPNIKENSIMEIKYGSDEKNLQPSKSLLIWMLQNIEQINKVENYGVSNVNSEAYKKRLKLFSGDRELQNEAIKTIQTVSNLPKKGWYIFEGYTCPDIFFETKDSVFIGEAKRTERNITTKTRWLDQRDQLIRHIDSKLDQDKNIYSFYILERSEYLKGLYSVSMKKYDNLDYFKLNLKHRDITSIERAKKSFIGFIFWEDISNHFNLDFPAKINK